MNQPYLVDGIDRIHPAIYALVQGEVNGQVVTINPQLLTLLGEYQRTCADWEQNYAGQTQFAQLSFWQRLKQVRLGMQLQREGQRLFDRKVLMEYRLSRLDLLAL